MSKQLPSSSQSGLSPRRRRPLNTGLLTVSGILLFVIAPAAYFWYFHQTRQLANSFIDRADQLLSEKKPREAAECFQRYLQINPKDSKARVRLAEAYDESTTTPQGKDHAIDLYYQALGYGESDGNTENHEFFKSKELAIYRRLGELLFEMAQNPFVEKKRGNYATVEKEMGKAMEIAKAKLDADPKNKQALDLQSQALRLHALAIYQQCKLDSWKKVVTEKRSASEILEQALASNAGDRELSRTLAGIYREEPQWLSEKQQSLTVEERNQRADQFINDLVQAYPKDADVLLILYHYREKYHLPEAEAALTMALKADPQNPIVLFEKARAEQSAAQNEFFKSGRIVDANPHFESALNYCRQVIKVKPENEDAYLLAAEIQQQLGNFEEAIQFCQAGQEKKSDSIRLNLLTTSLLLKQGRMKEAAQINHSQDKEGPLDVAERLIAEYAIQANQVNNSEMRRSLESLQQNVRLLRANWHAQLGNAKEALSLLQQTFQGEKTANSLQTGAFIYASLGQPFQAAQCCEDLVTLYPRMLQAHQAAADAWERVGHLDLAETHIRQALEIKDTAGNRFSLARILLRREMLKPPAERHRDAFEKAMNLAHAANVEADSPIAWQRELLSLQANMLFAADQNDITAKNGFFLQKLQALEQKYSQTADLLAQLVLIYEALQAPSEADRTLVELAKLKPQDSNTYLLQAQLAARRHQTEKAVAAFKEGMQKVSANQKWLLHQELVKFELSINHEADAAKDLEEMLRNQAGVAKNGVDAKTLELLMVFAEKSLNKGDLEAAKHWEDALIKLEGPEGSFWRYARAHRLLSTAKDAQDPQFAEAGRLQTEIQKTRPTWAPAYLLGGMILQRQDKMEEAVKAYQNAIHFGYRQLNVYESLVSLLQKLGRYAEAEGCLAGLKEQLPGSLPLSGLEISHATKQGQWKQAIELARRTTEAQPDQSQAKLWLSQLLEMDNQMDEAQQVIEKAVESHPNDPVVHYQLLTYYKSHGKIDLAKAHLEKLEKNSEIPQPELDHLLAQGYELSGGDAKAKRTWEKIAAATKDTPAEQTALAKELLNRDPQLAEKALRRSMQLDANYNAARLLLAKLLADRGGEAEWKEALSLINGSFADPREERIRQSVQAMLYATRGGKKNLEQAQAIMENLASNLKEASAEDILLLAKIYEAEGNVVAAKTRLQALLEEAANPPLNQVATYVELLLRQPIPKQAELRNKLDVEKDTWTKKLLSLSPDNPQVIGLRARWLKDSGHQSEIKSLIEDWATKQLPRIPKNPQTEIAFFETVGNLYKSVEAYPAAESWYRKAEEKSADHYLLLAQVLACQGRFEEALQLCQKAAEKDTSPQPVLIAATLLLEGHPEVKDFERAETLLGKAAQTFSDQPNVLNTLAAVLIVQERMDEAAVLYRRVLELHPRDVMAMNNLATVLVELPSKISEGKELIEKAISLAGPQAGLLDVKGMVLLGENKPDQAVQVLEEAATAAQADPRYSFHLAVAYLRMGNVDKAREALERAMALKLDQQILTPGDKKIRSELEKALKDKTAAG